MVLRNNNNNNYNGVQMIFIRIFPQTFLYRGQSRWGRMVVPNAL